MTGGFEPDTDCPLCPRLAAFRHATQKSAPSWFNAPVPGFGPIDARLTIVGLAPGLRGANRTGRPFTGDYAGDLLYAMLLKHGFARGRYEARPDDGLELLDCRITNAVRCVPPENKPTPAEIKTCRTFLAAVLSERPAKAAILALGRIAHDSTLAALGHRTASAPFSHGGTHALKPGLTLFDSYHCSRYNTNTGRLTQEMFDAVIQAIRDHLGSL